MATSLHLDQHGAKKFKANGYVFNSQPNHRISNKVCQDTIGDGSREVEDEDFMKQSSESSSSSDDEWCHEELSDILAKREAFFSSKCKYREGVTRPKDASQCMKCNKGGRLLVCSFDTCSFVFHKKCLASKAPFLCDSSGKFCCPFCIHSQSISDYWVAKKKVSLERNYLASFTKRNTNKAESQIQNKVVPFGLVNESSESIVSERCYARNNLGSFNKRNSNNNADTQIPNEAANFGLADRSSESEGREPSNEGSSEETSSMDSAVRLRKQKKPWYVPRSRRISVPWTRVEEETLKKWVYKFTYNGIPERRFPWRKILDLAASKFQKGRTPIDLKDKWRNMMNASNKSK
uniref:uncharacterized protein LOC122591986 n=1 Tax=Erigeron canadensis TaxID=72917 RepID=UPI001CB8D552|nr:uncharacterized protein LOC122591986 [Erigeron canadensis]